MRHIGWLIVLAGCGLFGKEDPYDTAVQSPGESGRMIGFVDAHNAYRSEEGIPDLVWDDELAEAAAEWIAYLAAEEDCELLHNYDSPLGENLAWNRGFESDPYTVTAGWYQEVAYYDYESNTCSDKCGHYTQLMWADTERVGCALDLCEDGAEIWMCTYDPPGNIEGQRPW